MRTQFTDSAAVLLGALTSGKQASAKNDPPQALQWSAQWFSHRNWGKCKIKRGFFFLQLKLIVFDVLDFMSFVPKARAHWLESGRHRFFAIDTTCEEMANSAAANEFKETGDRGHRKGNGAMRLRAVSAGVLGILGVARHYGNLNTRLPYYSSSKQSFQLSPFSVGSWCNQVIPQFEQSEVSPCFRSHKVSYGSHLCLLSMLFTEVDIPDCPLPM